MEGNRFTHLSVHSCYSFLRGGSTPEALCEEAAGMGMPSLALTDVNGLYGAVPFVRAAEAAGIRPILGVDLREPIRGAAGGGRDGTEPPASKRGFVENLEGADGPADPGHRPRKVLLLARSQEGYPELCRLISERHLERKFDLLRALLERGPGVVVLSGDPDLLAELVRERGAGEHALALCGRGPWRRTLGAARAAGLLRAGVKPVAVNDVWFARRWDHWRHHLITAIGLNRSLSGVPPAFLAPPSAWLREGADMVRLFTDLPEAVRNAAELAEGCEARPPLGGLHLPEFPLPESGNAAGRRSGKGGRDAALQHLRAQCLRGVVWRYGTRERPRTTEGQLYPADDPWCPVPGRADDLPVPDPADLREDVRRQLEHELGVIAGMGYADYFLVVADIVRYARQEGIPTCGRGSAANSVVAYALGLTHVDPLAHGLYFERFLNQGRSDAPDVDLDFSWRDRDRVLAYVYRTYGAGRVAMIATQVTFQARAAVREVAKVYGLPEGEIAQVTRRFGYYAGARELREKIAASPRFGGIDLEGEPWSTVLAAAEQLDGYPRHLGVHPGGIVIAPGPLTDYMPVERAARGLVITQWDMYPVEESGLVKIDLLGNRSLAVIDDACREVERLHGRHISYVHFDPTRDPRTRELIGRGDTVGCFYVESPATRSLLRKLECDDFDTLVAASSIIRPGVSSSGMMHAYIERHRGAPFTYLHPEMKELLGDTYGVMCYQEDVIKVAHHIAGMSLVDADGLRKSMSRRRNFEKIEKYRVQFLEGARAHGVAPDVAAELWRQVASFGGYSFCKAHSASYALVSFQAAWLRAHYPAEMIAAVLSNYGGYYTTIAYISEAMRMGLELRGPDVNESGIPYTGYTYSGAGRAGDGSAVAGNGWLRVGLCQVGGLSERGREALVAERKRGGPFTGFDDLVERVALKPAEIEALIRCGALDGLEEGTRPELMWRALAWRKRRALMLPLDGPLAGDPPAAPPYDEGTILAFEAETLGYLVSAHPLELYREAIARAAAQNGPPLIEGKELERYAGRRVRLIGWMVTAKPVYTVHDEMMEFISFEDTTALYEVTVFPRSYRRYASQLLTRGPFLLTGRVEEEYGAITVTLERLQVLGRGALVGTPGGPPPYRPEPATQVPGPARIAARRG